MAPAVPVPQQVVWRDTIHIPVSADTTLSRFEYNRLKGLAALTNSAGVLLTDYRNQLKACEDNRYSVYTLARKQTIVLQTGLKNQQNLMAIRPVYVPCPPSRKSRTWITILVGAATGIGGIILGSKL